MNKVDIGWTPEYTHTHTQPHANCNKKRVEKNWIGARKNNKDFR